MFGVHMVKLLGSLQPVMLKVAVVVMCAIGSTSGASAQSSGPLEPSGGTWKTVVIGDVQAYRLAPPPAPSSSTFRSDHSSARDYLAAPKTSSAWDQGHVTNWNAIARSLVAKYKTAPPKASRVYALLSVAQYDGLIAAWYNKYLYKRKGPLGCPPGEVYSYPSTAGSVGSVSADILSYLYPQEAENLQRLRAEAELVELKKGSSFTSDVSAGRQLGARIAKAIIARASSDNSDAQFTGTIPTGAGIWFSSAVPAAAPLLPLWGQVKGWFITSGDQFRPTPPPAFGSQEFNAALSEVRAIADTRTAEQQRIAEFWADGAGTPTPPGHWNEIASSSIVSTRMNELRAARTFALLNMAMMDAGIACWDAKYTYWLLRPSQADPGIKLAVPLPNFPAYTSGHSTFSGAAAGVLGYIFPKQSAYFAGLAAEASLSRVYGGIHYRFDSEVGLVTGRSVADLAVAFAAKDGSPK